MCGQKNVTTKKERRGNTKRSYVQVHTLAKEKEIEKI
jgi:hypothetical protein